MNQGLFVRYILCFLKQIFILTLYYKTHTQPGSLTDVYEHLSKSRVELCLGVYINSKKYFWSGLLLCNYHVITQVQLYFQFLNVIQEKQTYKDIGYSVYQGSWLSQGKSHCDRSKKTECRFKMLKLQIKTVFKLIKF